MKKINTKLQIVFTILMSVFFAPTAALAVVQSINSQNGQTQSFVNDTNVTITSSNDTHTLGWSGVLPFSRGGTGTSSFSTGSILFSNGITFAQNNSNLFWDNTNKRFGIGTSTPISALSVAGNTSILGDLNVTGNMNLGDNSLSASSLRINNVPQVGSLDFYSDNGVTLAGSFWVEPNGKYAFNNPDSFTALLDIGAISDSDKIFTFPNQSGTLGLLELNQTWSGLNKFEASTNSTIYIGSSIKSGCIAMGDSDGSGITYITANDGVLSASTTKPSICQ